ARKMSTYDTFQDNIERIKVNHIRTNEIEEDYLKAMELFMKWRNTTTTLTTENDILRLECRVLKEEVESLKKKLNKAKIYLKEFKKTEKELTTQIKILNHQENERKKEIEKNNGMKNVLRQRKLEEERLKSEEFMKRER